MKRPQPDAYDLAFASPAELRERNLRARDAARNKPLPRFTTRERVCELCDKAKPFLVRMQKFDKSGSVQACSDCLRELTE